MRGDRCDSWPRRHFVAFVPSKILWHTVTKAQMRGSQVSSIVNGVGKQAWHFYSRKTKPRLVFSILAEISSSTSRLVRLIPHLKSQSCLHNNISPFWVNTNWICRVDIAIKCANTHSNTHRKISYKQGLVSL